MESSVFEKPGAGGGTTLENWLAGDLVLAVARAGVSSPK